MEDPQRAKNLGRERVLLEGIVGTIDSVGGAITETAELLELAVTEEDQATATALEADLSGFEERVSELEFQRMFSGEQDDADAYVDIQAGSGGTEAQDWAEMLLRMYLRWAEARGFDSELIEASSGDVAGIKSATVRVVAIMPLAGCAPRPACTGWCVNPV